MSNNVFLYTRPEVKHQVLQQVILQASSLDLSTGRPDPLSNMRRLWRTGYLRHFSFGFIICLHVDELDEYCDYFQISVHHAQTFRDGVVLIVTETLDRWVELCNKYPHQPVFQRIKNLLIQTEFSGAFL